MRMRRDVSLAGFMITREEWDALDPIARQQLYAAMFRQPERRAAVEPEAPDAPDAYDAYELRPGAA